MAQTLSQPDRNLLQTQAELYRRLAEMTRNRDNSRKLLALANAYEAQASTARS